MSGEEVQDHLPSCPICSTALEEGHRTEGGWECGKCGEFVPKGLEIPPRIEEAPPCHGRADVKPRRNSGE
jgi:ribosomal protein L37AE/L43A